MLEKIESFLVNPLVMLIRVIVTLVFGGLLVFLPSVLPSWILTFIGIVFILSGLLSLIDLGLRLMENKLNDKLPL